MTRLRPLALWLLPLALALTVGSALRTHHLDLLASPSVRWSFGDSASGGASRAWSDSGIPWRFGMSLRPGFAYPYAAAGLHLVPGRAPLDLSRYDSLVLEGRSRRQHSLRIVIQAIEPGETDTTRSLSYIPFEGGLAIEKAWSRQAVAVRDLSIPLWWSQREGAVPRPHPRAWQHAHRLFLENGLDTPPGTDDTLEVRSLHLVGTTWLPLALLVPAALFLSALIHLRLKERPAGPALEDIPSAPPAAGPMRDVPLASRRDEEMRLLLDWVGEHYMDPDLCVERAGRACGIHPRRIPSVLRAAGHASFPTFVNSLRVEQAKRLLRDTDRTVSEIAVAVGVPNVSHFHRLFKAGAGMTPLEWREAPAPPSAGP